ncbi:hypothetical protein SCLCIDRAFT_13268 [Scleroderma citrinum Foug A]|uniref:C2H2-type domain-containing protein n=1 Tax=Scleroderma citrinum Foug A TaxID=1036808 RepID=A0A0C3E8T0_9AGAM|nr:hypothetical protein SCLCIDRAFT_13268 [Scleroderma citrinum Foug A]
MSDRRGYSYAPEPSRGGQWSGSSAQPGSRYPTQTSPTPGSYPHPYSTMGTPNVAPVQPGSSVPYHMNHPSSPPLPGHHAGAYPSQPSNQYSPPANVYPRQTYPPPPVQHDNNTSQYPTQASPHPSQHFPSSQSSAPYFATSGQYSGQYPASPARPYSCDLCALSFNRQHDLKRHRETHSGEKPFSCNGGCGKTFTRKDALKRHQLVKHCGHDDGA